MDIPEAPEAWTYATMVEVVEEHDFEPDRFDYKAVLNATDPSQRNKRNRNLCKTASSMANTGGGYILFGVRDRNQNVATPRHRRGGPTAGLPP